MNLLMGLIYVYILIAILLVIYIGLHLPGGRTWKKDIISLAFGVLWPVGLAIYMCKRSKGIIRHENHYTGEDKY